MKWSVKLVGMLLATGMGAVGSRAADDDLPMENVTLPIEHYSNGVVKVQVTAKRANIPPRGDVVARGVRIEMFDAEGRLDGSVQAEDCRYNRETRVATSDLPVRFERREIEVTGVGFDWNAGNQFIRIHRDARVVFRRNAIRGFTGRGWRKEEDD